MANGAERIRQVKTLEQNNREAVPMVDLQGNLDSSARKNNPSANAIVRFEDGRYKHQASGVILDNQGVIWPAELDQTDLNGFTNALIAFQDKAQLWLGDTITYLMQRFELSVEDIEFQYDLNERQIEEYISVCQAVPRDLRPDHPRISYSHIRLVSREKYNDKERQQYLELAATKDWTVSQFEEWLRGKKKLPSVGKAAAAWDAVQGTWKSFTKAVDFAVDNEYMSREQRMNFRRDAIKYLNKKLRFDEMTDTDEG